jgi:hypothetical protein
MAPTTARIVYLNSRQRTPSCVSCGYPLKKKQPGSHAKLCDTCASYSRVVLILEEHHRITRGGRS